MLISHPSSAFSALLVFSSQSDLIAANSPEGCPGQLTAVQCSSGWTLNCLGLQVSLMPAEALQKTKSSGSKRQ